MYTPYDSDIVNIFSYLFKWNYNDTNALVTKIKAISTGLESLCGPYTECNYTSIILDGSGMQDISLSDLCLDISNKKDGIYSIQWEYNDTLITLGLTLDSRSDYIEGNIAFAKAE